jgi:uncharacterized protein DUF5989
LTESVPVSISRELNGHPEYRAGSHGKGVMSFKESVKEKVQFWQEFWAFLKVRKKWWLAPIIVLSALLGILIVLTAGSALAPFIYTIF